MWATWLGEVCRIWLKEGKVWHGGWECERTLTALGCITMRLANLEEDEYPNCSVL